MRAMYALEVGGFIAVLIGIAWIHPPAALIVGGLGAILAANLEGTNANTA